MLSYVNGDLVPANEARISVLNAGFNFADGVCEGVRVYGGEPFRVRDIVAAVRECARAAVR